MSSTSTTSHEMPRSNSPEPKAGLIPVPVTIFIVLAMIFYWATLYIDQNGGGFNSRVYTPYASGKQLDKLAPKSKEDPLLVKGREMYMPACGVCHGENGLGSSANGCPPLAGSEWVTGTPSRLVRIMSKGLTGPIQVKNQTYGSGAMPNVGDTLPGDEKQRAEAIAAIATYIRRTWGNKAPAVKPADAEKIRAEIVGHSQAFTADELLKVE